VNGSLRAVGQRGCRKTPESPFGLCLPAHLDIAERTIDV
jgi:hypothetical protein